MRYVVRKPRTGSEITSVEAKEGRYKTQLYQYFMKNDGICHFFEVYGFNRMYAHNLEEIRAAKKG